VTTLTLRQAQQLLAFFGGHDCEVTIISHTKLMETTPAAQPGLYAYCTEYPEEGCEYLGPTEVDDELATKGLPPDAKAEALRALLNAIPGTEEHDKAVSMAQSALRTSGVADPEQPSKED
jgi:hypothetical protein